MSKNKPKSRQATRKPKRRTFSEEFKLEAVKLVTEQNYKASEAARSLGIDASLLRYWVNKDSNHEDDTESEELKQLRAENKRLRMERDILKKATAFFASEKN